MDTTLLLLGLLLAGTITAFLADVIPYPIGIFILSLLFVGRLLYLQGKK